MLVVSVHSCSLYRSSAQSAHTFDTSSECFKAGSSQLYWRRYIDYQTCLQGVREWENAWLSGGWREEVRWVRSGPMGSDWVRWGPIWSDLVRFGPIGSDRVISHTGGNSRSGQWQTGIWWTGIWRTGKWRTGKKNNGLQIPFCHFSVRNFHTMPLRPSFFQFCNFQFCKFSCPD